jgi:hypothetical protein
VSSVVKEINSINARELATSKGMDDSWHNDYRGNALPFPHSQQEL